NWKGFPSTGCEAPPCWNGSIVNSVANSVRLSPLAAPLEQKWLSTSRFSVFMLNGSTPLGGTPPTLSPLTCCKSTTLRDGYGISLLLEEYDPSAPRCSRQGSGHERMLVPPRTAQQNRSPSTELDPSGNTSISGRTPSPGVSNSSWTSPTSSSKISSRVTMK